MFFQVILVQFPPTLSQNKKIDCGRAHEGNSELQLLLQEVGCCFRESLITLALSEVRKPHLSLAVVSGCLLSHSISARMSTGLPFGLGPHLGRRPECAPQTPSEVSLPQMPPSFPIGGEETGGELEMRECF